MLGFCAIWCPLALAFFLSVLLLTELAESKTTKAAKACDALLMRCMFFLTKQ